MLGRGQWVRQGSMRSDARVSGEYATKGLVGERIHVLTPVSAIRGLPHLLHQGEVLSLRDYHKWRLRPILGLGRDRYVFAVYHPGWLVTTPGVLISGHIVVGVIFSGRKGGYL